MPIATGTYSQEKQDIQKKNALNTRQDQLGTFLMQKFHAAHPDRCRVLTTENPQPFYCKLIEHVVFVIVVFYL